MNDPPAHPDTEELRLLRRLVTAFASSPDPLQVLQAVLRDICTVLKAGGAVFIPVTETEDKAPPVASYGLSANYVQEMSERMTRPLADSPLGRGPAGDLFRQTLAQRGVLGIADVRQDPLFAPRLELAEREGYRALAALPLVFQDRPVGVLIVYFPAPHVLQPAEAQFLETVASAVATIVETAHLFAETQRRASESEQRAARLALVNRISTLVNSTLDLDAILRTACTEMAHAFGVGQSGVVLFDRDRQFGQVVAEYQAQPDDTASRVRIPLAGNPSLERVIATRQPLAIADAEHDPLLTPIRDVIQLRRIRSILIVPLVVQGEVVGTIGLDAIGTPRTFTAEEQELAGTIANQVALAIEKAQLYAASRQDAEHLRKAFHMVGAAVASPLALDEVLQIIVGLAAEALRADFCEVRFLDDEAQQLVLGASWGTGSVGPGQPAARLGLAGSLGGVVTLEEAPVHIPDLRQDPRTWHIGLVGYEKLIAYLGVPLTLGQKVIGVLGLARRRPEPFSADEIELLTSFAHQAAIAIEEANLLAEAQRTQQRSQAIIQNSADGIVLIDGQQRVVGFNPALERLTGWRAEEVLGVPCYEVLQTQSQGRAFCQDLCPIRQAGDRDFLFTECQIRSRDGRLIDVGISYGVIRDERQRLAGVVEVIRDISQQKELDRLRSDFVSTVSHELRTPLALIKGYAATLLRPDIELERETRQRFIQQIDEAANRLTRLIDNLLSVSRIEAGRLEVLPASVDLSRLASKVIQDLKGAAIEHQFLLQVTTPRPVAWADADKVEQVLLNLLHNAIKFSPPSSTITVSVADSLPAGQADREYLLVSVRDQGRGVPPEHRDRIFERFYQVETGVARSASGTGLGLYICKNLVEAHGGRIWVEPAEGGGSVFRFTLPRA